MASRGNVIAKNASMLYIRMIIVTLITLYTSRVIFQILGEDDYGIFNVAGSLIAFFSLVNTALAGSVQRYINFEYKEEQTDSFKKIFNISVELHILLSIIIFIVGETIGVIFFKYLNIPPDRYNAALYVYQFSLLSTIATLLSIPYQALIIATEKMNFFAYNSLIEAALKLIIVYLLLTVRSDKLIIYAFLFFIVTSITQVSFYIYAKKYIGLPKFRYVDLREKICKNMCKFSLWNVLGNASTIIFLQGINILLNLFYGVIVNAAMGVTNQVTNTVSRFITNFQVAYKPAIVKAYANQEITFLKNLILKASKMSFFLLFVVCFPLMLNVQMITHLWLNTVPEFTNQFIKILLISLICNSIAVPLWNTIEAKGNIRGHQIFTACVQVGALPVAYLFLKLRLSPAYVVSLHVAATILILIQRFYLVSQILQINIYDYIKNLFYPIFKVVIFVLGIYIVYPMENSWSSLALYISVASLSAFFIGLDRGERTYIKNIVLRK